MQKIKNAKELAQEEFLPLNNDQYVDYLSTDEDLEHSILHHAISHIKISRDGYFMTAEDVHEQDNEYVDDVDMLTEVAYNWQLEDIQYVAYDQGRWYLSISMTRLLNN